jgi:hypothetical protein
MSSALKHPCDEAFIRSTRAEAPCARKVEPWVLAATILGTSMAFIDETAVSGYRVVMLVATAAGQASALGAALLIEGKKKPEEQPDDPETRVLAA